MGTIRSPRLTTALPYVKLSFDPNGQVSSTDMHARARAAYGVAVTRALSLTVVRARAPLPKLNYRRGN